MAHGCAHSMLHREAIGGGICDDALYRSGLSNQPEHEANGLAADIPMPHHLIHEAMDDGCGTIGLPAEFLQVSGSAMSVRTGVPYGSRSRATP